MVMFNKFCFSLSMWLATQEEINHIHNIVRRECASLRAMPFVILFNGVILHEYLTNKWSERTLLVNSGFHLSLFFRPWPMHPPRTALLLSHGASHYPVKLFIIPLRWKLWGVNIKAWNIDATLLNSWSIQVKGSLLRDTIYWIHAYVY